MAYTISVEQIMRAVPTAYRARVTEFVATFNQYADTFGINTTARVVHFLAQVTWESGYFKCVEENLNYSAKGLLNTFKGRFTEATAAQYARKDSMQLNRSMDIFLYHTRHVERMPEPSRGGGGGSSTFTSSSGTTHGGGGGKF